MKRILTAMAMLLAATAAASAQQPKRVAITSFGEHPALQGVVDGFKASMKERGYTEGKDVIITFTHVNWDRNLIPQMLTKVASDKPDVVVTITTPVTQSAVRALTDPATPVVFAAVQDPVVAGVIPSWDKAEPEHDRRCQSRRHGRHAEIHQGNAAERQARRRAVQSGRRCRQCACASGWWRRRRNTASSWFW